MTATCRTVRCQHKQQQEEINMVCWSQCVRHCGMQICLLVTWTLTGYWTQGCALNGLWDTGLCTEQAMRHRSVHWTGYETQVCALNRLWDTGLCNEQAMRHRSVHWTGYDEHTYGKQMECLRGLPSSHQILLVYCNRKQMHCQCEKETHRHTDTEPHWHTDTPSMKSDDFYGKYGP
jgi:hypothetical protein